MPKYRVERKCYFRNRLFDPQVEPVVNLDVKPKEAPRHFTCIDKPQKQSAKGSESGGSGSEEKSE